MRSFIRRFALDKSYIPKFLINYEKKAAWVSKNVSYSSKCKSQSFASETKPAGELVTIFLKPRNI